MTRLLAGGGAALLLLAGGALAAEGAPPAAAPTLPGLAAPSTPAPPSVTFDEAVARAQLNAVISQVAAQELRRAEALLWQARAGSLPALDTGAALTRLDANRVVQDRVVASKEQEGANVSLTLPLVAPARWYQWSHAVDAEDVARAGEADVRRTAAITAARAYLSVVAARRALEVARVAVDTARAHFDFAHARREGGVGTRLDEVRAEDQLATAKAQVQGSETALSQAREALGIATGNDGPLDARTEPALGSAEVGEARAMEDASADRTDVRAARERTRAADRVARDSWADWLPTLLATGEAFYQHPATLTTPETGWQAQLVLSFPLLEGGLRVGQRREREALAAEARTQLDGQLRQARSEVRTAITTLTHAEEALAQYRRSEGSAAEALRLVTEAYQAGATTSLDVTDAEQRARDAAAAAVVGEDAVRQARLDLLAATGHFP